MSTTDRLARRVPGRSTAEAGFTLIEVLVALTILAVISLSIVPLLVSGLKASQLARAATEAKNLSVARMAAMAALPYHVAYPPFVDLLDEYYPNASTTQQSIASTGGTGVYVPSGTIPGQSAPSAYYQVSFGSPPEPNGFSQVVYTQFLDSNNSAGTLDTVLTPATGYVSQSNALPSLLVGVTVLTSFQAAGHTHSQTSYTEITDTGHDATLVLAQAGASAISVSSLASDGTELSGSLAVLGLNATLANVSGASASVLGGHFTRTDPTGVNSYPATTGVQVNVAAPPTAGSTGPGTPVGASGCSWNFLGPTADDDVSATVANTQPDTPADLATNSGAQVSVSLTGDDQAACSGDPGFAGTDFAFTNAVNSTDTTNPALDIPAGYPMVSVADVANTNSTVVGATGDTDTPPLAFNSSGQITNPVTSQAAVSYGAPTELFPGMSFVTQSTLACPDGDSCTTGSLIPTDDALAVLDLTQAQIACSASGTPATGSYAGTLFLWEQPSPSSAGSYVAVPLNWTSSSSAAPPALPSLSTVVGYTATGVAVPLSTYLASWSTSGLVQGTSGAGGDHVIPGALSIGTQPTLESSGTPIAGTGIDLTLAKVSCVSQDNR